MEEQKDSSQEDPDFRRYDKDSSMEGQNDNSQKDPNFRRYDKDSSMEEQKDSSQEDPDFRHPKWLSPHYDIARQINTSSNRRRVRTLKGPFLTTCFVMPQPLVMNLAAAQQGGRTFL